MHGFVVDLMFRSHENMGSGRKLNVMDYMFNEMHQAMVERKVPPYGPYIQALINTKWRDVTGRRLEEDMKATIHPEKGLRVKKVHIQPAARGERPVPEGEGDAPEDEPRMEEEPSWMGKLMGKLKRSFCLKLDMQDRAYEAHVRARKDTRRQKAIMKKLDLPVSPESDRSITPKDKWISHYTWSSGDEEDVAPTTSFSGWGNWDANDVVPGSSTSGWGA
jgi:hypothetical protein